MKNLLFSFAFGAGCIVYRVQNEKRSEYYLIENQLNVELLVPVYVLQYIGSALYKNPNNVEYAIVRM
jgi:hypothetical protein